MDSIVFLAVYIPQRPLRTDKTLFTIGFASVMIARRTYSLVCSLGRSLRAFPGYISIDTS